jgi:hypothetical protein
MSHTGQTSTKIDNLGQSTIMQYLNTPRPVLHGLMATQGEYTLETVRELLLNVVDIQIEYLNAYKEPRGVDTDSWDVNHVTDRAMSRLEWAHIGLVKWLQINDDLEIGICLCALRPLANRKLRELEQSACPEFRTWRASHHSPISSRENCVDAIGRLTSYKARLQESMRHRPGTGSNAAS